MSKTCACGSEKSYKECCEPYLLGTQKPSTAEQLMRSRYTAFAVGEMDYIYNTHHESTRKGLDMDGVKSWALNSEWLGLEILGTDKGSEKDSEGQVEFRCKFNFNGKEQAHHELSTFTKENGQWFFVDGVQKNNTVRRSEPKVGRNDPCPCGSGKKAKKCCHQ
ncbi:MAG: YchJ family protein [Bacteriovorax sp.]|nr:YchJ family protein [Bacteriovorax sp.]